MEQFNRYIIQHVSFSKLCWASHCSGLVAPTARHLATSKLLENSLFQPGQDRCLFRDSVNWMCVDEVRFPIKTPNCQNQRITGEDSSEVITTKMADFGEQLSSASRKMDPVSKRQLLEIVRGCNNMLFTKNFICFHEIVHFCKIAMRIYFVRQEANDLFNRFS